MDGSITWDVESIRINNDCGFCFDFPDPFYWTKNGDSLYFTHNGSGDGCYVIGGNGGRDFMRLDLSTRKIEDLYIHGSWISISPDERFIAALTWEHQGLLIKDLGTGKDTQLEFALLGHEIFRRETATAINQGYIVWSPDGGSLAFTIIAGYCDYPSSFSNTYIVKVDLHSMTQQMLVENDDGNRVTIEWPEANRIHLEDPDGNTWWLNPGTGEVEGE